MEDHGPPADVTARKTTEDLCTKHKINVFDHESFEKRKNPYNKTFPKCIELS